MPNTPPLVAGARGRAGRANGRSVGGSARALVAAATLGPAVFEALEFRYPFRRYQRMILDRIEMAPAADGRHHLVAPPGSGKTIVGLELIRRFEAPAVVFAPTTTIQQQWRDQVSMFGPRGQALDALTSLDPERLAPITILTYQVISTPGAAGGALRDLASKAWIEELLREGQADDEAAATRRIERMAEANPRAHERELASRATRVRHELLRADPSRIADLLHPNARALIEGLAAAGVRTVVLDECHHLLDYWAIVLRALVGRLEAPKVVGLTATLPSPDGDDEFENYESLLGDVDFEVPTPAVVKEGDLAPYRDLAWFVEPTDRERAHLRNVVAAFEEATTNVTAGLAFADWLRRLLAERPSAAGDPTPWPRFLVDRPLLAIAAVRLARDRGLALPDDVVEPVEAEGDVELDDWLVLLERFALDVLKLSADPADHELLRRLRRVLLPFGLTLTERGLRQGRSVGDLVLAFSEAKDPAVVEILALEAAALGDRLRAVVVTDFERMSSGVGRARDVLDRDAGSAVRVFGRLAADARTHALGPVLVTGRTILATAELGDWLLSHLREQIAAGGLRAMCRLEVHAEGIVEVVGDGPDWSPGAYVRLVTVAFEAGVSRCLVGTRGIFGEGWDSLSLNTLVDLTSVTTSTSVQQLRGRTLRKDPTWPRKVGHAWDVVCVDRSFERGNTDFRRFERRHGRYWGIVPPGFDPWSGQIMRGLPHVDPRLALDLAERDWKRVDFRRSIERSRKAIGDRSASYDLWRVGDEYQNFASAGASVDPANLQVRTAFTIRETLKAMLRAFRASVVTGLTLVAAVLAQVLLELEESGADAAVIVGLLLVIAAVGLPIVFVWNARAAWRIARWLLVEQPPDAVLLDVGRALLAALRETGLVSEHLSNDFVRVVELPDASYEVLLDYASPADAAVFVEAYRQVLGPIRDPRYLILRDDGRMPSLRWRAVWLPMRAFLRGRDGSPPSYHAVPDILGTKRERAEAFARHWTRYVGGGELVHTRSDAGRAVLLAARARRRPEARSLAFERWR